MVDNLIRCHLQIIFKIPSIDMYELTVFFIAEKLKFDLIMWFRVNQHKIIYWKRTFYLNSKCVDWKRPAFHLDVIPIRNFRSIFTCFVTYYELQAEQLFEMQK